MNSILSVYGPGVVALGGSRSLQGAAAGWVGSLALALVGSGRSLAVGCAVGADAAAVSALSGSPALRVLAAWGPVGAGSCSVSAVRPVAAHFGQGGAVSWWAGGPSSLPLSVRLSERTRAVSRACTAGAVVALGSPRSVGSLLLARSVTARGLPVVAVALGFRADLLPPLGAGSWSPLGSAGSASAAVWVPGQWVLPL